MAIDPAIPLKDCTMLRVVEMGMPFARRRRVSIRRTLGLLLVFGCAKGSIDPGPGAGGMGGAGGASPGPCGVVCSQVVKAPDCHYAFCNTKTGMCEVRQEVDGAPCDDGLFCTVKDFCWAGECMPGNKTHQTQGNITVWSACAKMKAPQCMVMICDEDTKGCVATAGDNGGFCATEDPCWDGRCSDGQCLNYYNKCK
jgi:hypothetical protein